MFLAAVGILVHFFPILTFKSYFLVSPMKRNREMNTPVMDITKEFSSGTLMLPKHINTSDYSTVKSKLIQMVGSQKRNIANRDHYSADEGKFTIVLDPGRNILLLTAFLDLTDRNTPVIRVLCLLELKTYSEDEDCRCVVHGTRYDGKLMTHVSRLSSSLAAIGPPTGMKVEGDDIHRGYRHRVVPCHFPERFLSWRDLRVGLKCGGKSDVRLPANSTVKVETPVFIPDEERMEFGVCVSVVYKHLDPYRLVEWLEMQRILGVGKIFIYNSSIGFQESRVLWDYQDEGFVEVHQIPPIQKLIDGQSERVGDRRARQVLGLNDCMFRNMFQFKYMCGIDTDEFIMPQVTFNLSSLLRAIHHDRAPKLNSYHIGTYMFETVNFLSEPGYDPRPDLSKPWYTHYLRYRFGLPVHSSGIHAKIIFNPRACKALFVHRCSELQRSFVKVIVKDTTALLNHHKTTYCTDRRLRRLPDNRLCLSPHLRSLYDGVLKYETLLVKSVTDRLHHLGLSTDTEPSGESHSVLSP